jgi:hypothetical protein
MSRYQSTVAIGGAARRLAVCGRRLGRAAAILAFGGAPVACGGEGNAPEGEEYFLATPDLERHEAPSFEEFQEMTRVRGVLGVEYLVQGDLPVHSDAELRDYYESVVAGRIPKLAAGVHSPNGSTNDVCNEDPLPAHCVWDKMPDNKQLGITYCVSDEFLAYSNGLGGTMHATMVGGMALAGTAWQQGGNLFFNYIPAQDTNCSVSDSPPGIHIKVVPWEANAASWDNGRLFWNPSGGGSAIQVSDGLMHELGHVLGFTHENFRYDWAFGCPPVYNLIPLTPEPDPLSIMMTSGCGFSESNSIVSAGDRHGAGVMYGTPGIFVFTYTG